MTERLTFIGILDMDRETSNHDVILHFLPVRIFGGVNVLDAMRLGGADNAAQTGIWYGPSPLVDAPLEIDDLLFVYFTTMNGPGSGRQSISLSKHLGFRAITISLEPSLLEDCGLSHLDVLLDMSRSALVAGGRAILFCGPEADLQPLQQMSCMSGAIDALANDFRCWAALDVQSRSPE